MSLPLLPTIMMGKRRVSVQVAQWLKLGVSYLKWMSLLLCYFSVSEVLPSYFNFLFSYVTPAVKSVINGKLALPDFNLENTQFIFD